MQSDKDDQGVRKERTGWRDELISKRHRKWSEDCPASDIDFLMIEYDLGKFVGLPEYKHYTKKLSDFSHPTYRALIDVANGYRQYPIPCWVAKYWPEFWGFQVFPLNARAEEYFQFGEFFEERTYVMKLFQIRSDTRQFNNFPIRSLWKNFCAIEPTLCRQKP